MEKLRSETEILRRKLFLDLEKFLYWSNIMFPDFPSIDDDTRQLLIEAWEEISVYKKGAAFYFIHDGKGEYIETINYDISWIDILFFCTEYDFTSKSLWYDTQILDICSDANSSYIEILLEAIQDFDPLRYDPVIWEKLYELYVCFVDKMFCFLEKIDLVYYNGIYIVPWTDVSFTKKELEKIKATTK